MFFKVLMSPQGFLSMNDFLLQPKGLWIHPLTLDASTDKKKRKKKLFSDFLKALSQFLAFFCSPIYE